MNIKQLLQNETQPIVIFGASVVGREVYDRCLSVGISASAFCDDQKLDQYKGVNVFSLNVIKKRYPEAVFIVATTNANDALHKITEMGNYKWILAGLILNDQENFPCITDFYNYSEMEAQIIDRCIESHSFHNDKENLFATSIDLLVTERCSLKCLDCCNLMQYFQNPQDISIDEIKKNLKLIVHYFDSVHELRVIGGEALLHRNFAEILQLSAGFININKILVYTNGTIVPARRKLEALALPNVVLAITDYGPISHNLDKLCEKCERYQIRYYITKAEEWVFCSSIKKHNRSMKENTKLFRSCCANNTFTVSNGKLYRCPFIANAVRLCAIEEAKDDRIDFDSLNMLYKEKCEAKRVINDFLYNRDFFPACDYCEGRPYGKITIKPAIQTKRPLDFDKF